MIDQRSRQKYFSIVKDFLTTLNERSTSNRYSLLSVVMKFNLRDLKFRHEYFPLLLPFFYFLHYYFVNYPFFQIKVAASLLVQYVLATILLLFVFFIFFKNWRRASLFTFFLLFVQFFFILFSDYLTKRLNGSIGGKGLFPLAILTITLACLFLYLKTTSRDLRRVVRFLNVLMLSWIVVELGIFLTFRNYLNSELKKTIAIKEGSNGAKPDIYLLILDEYAGQKTLVDKFQFDNNEFLSYLRSKNFHIVSNSKSNYNVTLFSMASMLSLDRLTITDYEKPSQKDFILAGLKLNESAIGQFFRHSGYEIYNLSLFRFLNLPSPFKHPYLRDFAEEVKSKTLTDLVLRNYETLFLNSGNNSKNTNESLAFNYNNALLNCFLHSSFESTKPKFVYAHFLMPHFPHVLNSDGQLVDPKLQLSQDSYLGYLKYCNKKIVPVIDKILASSATPPIILLMSDHGFRGFSKPTDPTYYFMNLNAIYLPDQKYAGWYDGMSNVNQFRILLNQKFNQNLPLLKDTSIRLMGKDF